MEEDTAGDPGTFKKWTRKDLREVRSRMNDQGVDICTNTVRALLKDQNYALRVNRKSIAETHHPDRNRQFEIISDFRKRFEDSGNPILSVDGKKKELIGNFKNPGRVWTKRGEEVFEHDFRSFADAIATPYGLYEVLLNRGTIVIGTSSDTPEFAVDCLDMWITEYGWENYPTMSKMLILCDGGGSNGYRPRMWKHQLYHTIARRYGIQVTVCHYPSGASKYNPVERRLFSYVSMEWAGRPLRSLELMMHYIESTTTEKGLKVAAKLNERQYQKGRKVSNNEFNSIPIIRHSELPAWNYSICPDHN